MASLSLVPIEDDESPPTEPVSLDEAKAHCRVDIDDDDALLVGLIIAGRQHLENVTGRRFVTATWALTLDGWPCEGWIGVPRAPLINTEEAPVVITYLDTEGATQTLASSQYRIDAPTGPTAARGRIEPAYGVTWPSLRTVSNCVTVTFAAGYGANADAVPEALRLAIKMWILPRYERRAMDADERRAFSALYTPYKTWARQ